MPDPGQPGDPKPKNDDWLVRRIQDVERDLREFKQALGAITGFTFVDGKIMSATFDGDLDAPAAGNTGVAMGGPHDTLIVNNILLKGAIIGDDALTNPVKVDIADGVQSGFTPTSTMTTRVTDTVTVPAGFTNALVMAIATAGLIANASGSFIQVRPVVNGVAGDTITSQAGANIAMSVSSAQAYVLSGLSGTFDVSAQSAGTTGGVQASTGNARIAATVTFLR
jgi:hypothetical protein